MTALDVLVPQDTVLPQISTTCQTKLDQSRDWHSTFAVRTGLVIVGVRADTADTARWLESELEPIRAREFDADVLANFSVTMGKQFSRERLLLVYGNHEIIARRRDQVAVISDLIELLDEGPRLLEPDSAVLHAGAVWDAKGNVVLVPGDMHRNLLMRRAQFEGEGFRIGVSRCQRIDLDTMELSLPCVDPTLEAMRIAQQTEPGSHPPLVVTTWGLPAAGDRVFHLRPADGVMAALGMVANRRIVGVGSVLNGLASAARRVRFTAVPRQSAPAQAATLIDLLGHDGAK